MMKLSERRARDRGRRAVADLRLVTRVRERLPVAGLEDIVAMGLEIEEHLAPLRRVIGPAIAAREALPPHSVAKLDLAAAEALPVVEALVEAQVLLTDRAHVLVAEQGLAV